MERGEIMSRLQNKAVIITGGAGGIGAGMAKAMVKEGANVLIVDVNEEAGAKVLAELREFSPKSEFLQFDLMKHDELHKIVDFAVEKFGRLDVLVNNAHVSRQIMFEETKQEHFDLSFGTGFYPTFYLMQAALPHLKETKGNIINFASGAGISGQKTQTAYAAAKEAIRGMTRVVANEVAQYGVTVNIISPVAMTEGVDKWKAAFPDMYEDTLSKVPLGRFGDPEQDIGRVAVFLASEDSKYMTGQTFMVDGGVNMRP